LSSTLILASMKCGLPLAMAVFRIAEIAGAVDPHALRPRPMTGL
jgi:hypothetical protein